MLDLAWHKTPSLIQKLLPSLRWRENPEKKTIYLTFDDGPIPELTPKILQILSTHNAVATFFCVGDNISKHPEIFKQVVSAGHTVGNHTYNHVKGWKLNSQDYLENIDLCQAKIDELSNPNKKIFRPPYGQIKPSQANKLKRSGFKIIMWDVLSKDYETNLNHEKALNAIIKATRSGSIIVFHDNIKAQNNVLTLLPLYINHFKKKGFKFESL